MAAHPGVAVRTGILEAGGTLVAGIAAPFLTGAGAAGEGGAELGAGADAVIEGGGKAAAQDALAPGDFDEFVNMVTERIKDAAEDLVQEHVVAGLEDLLRKAADEE